MIKRYLWIIVFSLSGPANAWATMEEEAIALIEAENAKVEQAQAEVNRVQAQYSHAHQAVQGSNRRSRSAESGYGKAHAGIRTRQGGLARR